MTEVLIEKRSIGNQKISSIEKQQVVLPFNITQLQVGQLKNLLDKTELKLNAQSDRLTISNLSFNGTQIKSINKPIPNSNFRIQKAYVATIKSNIVDKVNSFYTKVVEPINSTIPTINIDKETNLQEALGEVTEEIDVTTINNALNSKNTENSQILANDPYNVTTQPVNNIPETPQQIEQPANNVTMPNIQSEITVPTENMPLQPKVKIKKLNGYILAIPIVIIWLGAVLIGTIKLVTNILT